jgi:hypothetical protein
MLIQIEPRTDRETGVQLTSKDGTERKWTVQVVASTPSRFDANRTDNEVLTVTVTCADDPAGKVAEGDQVEFANWTVGVMDPELNTAGRIRGGRLFDQATGIRTRVPAGGKS